MKYLLMFCIAALATGPAVAQELDEAFTAKLFSSKGVVECLKAGTTTWRRVKAPYFLEVGDNIRTGPKAVAEIYIRYGSKVRLSSDTLFVLTKVAPQENAVEVMKGKMQAWIRKFAGRGFSVRTPAAVCAVRGTVFEVEVAENGRTMWDLFSGAIQIADNLNHTIDLAPNQRVEVSQAAGAATPAAIPENVKPPEEPAKIKEEKTETKAEQIIEIKAKEEAEAAKQEEKKKEEKKDGTKTTEAEPVEEPAVVEPVVEPATGVIPTQEVKESQEVSGSTP